jgi:3-hydroxyisobutyrate dehydrogenase-like beta-hydroxyacid dehydrogenase
LTVAQSGGPDSCRVGFIGLGAMGAPMVRCLIGHGFRPTLWARREASLAPFRDDGVAIARSPAGVGTASDVVGVCVFDDDDVRSVLLGSDGVFEGMNAGGIVAVHATVAPAAIAALAREGETRGISVLDAPISGGTRRATDGTLAILVGGEARALERARPVFDSFGSTITHVGPAGRAQTIKLVNNTLGSANTRLAYLAVEAAVSLGVERDIALEVLGVSSGASAALAGIARGLFDDDTLCAHHLPMNSKDMALFQALRDAAGISPSVLDTAARETNRMFAERSARVS